MVKEYSSDVLCWRFEKLLVLESSLEPDDENSMNSSQAAMKLEDLQKKVRI